MRSGEAHVADEPDANRPGRRRGLGQRGDAERVAQVGAAITCRARRASATFRPSGPCTAHDWKVRGPSIELSSGAIQLDTRPTVGRMPTTPQHAAGKRIDPPMSLPCASGVMPAARELAAPPLEPPGVWSALHGLRVLPCASLVENQRTENAGTLLRPRRIAPAPRRAPMHASSSVAVAPARAAIPWLIRRPFCGVLSLVETGTPCSGPSASPAATASSARRASARASSGRTSTRAFNMGLTSSILLRQDSTTSTAEISRVRIPAAS
nr:hypothetical protein GCM10020093_009580 [Planobispora longispora]